MIGSSKEREPIKSSEWFRRMMDNFRISGPDVIFPSLDFFFLERAFFF